MIPAQDELVVIITEPGRVGGNRSAQVVVRGAIGRSHAAATVSTAVAPTILYALGVPVSHELPSGPLLDVFDPRFTGRYPPRYVASYGPPSTSAAVRTGQPLDQEMIDRLRSLGYVR
jgi:hypothetical protein